MKKTLALLLPWAAGMLMLLSACGGDGKLPLSVARIGLPQFGKDEPVIQQANKIGNGIEQTATFAMGDVPLARQYEKWLRKNGWNIISQDESVTSFNFIFGKDKTVLTLNYNSQSGVYITVSRPLAEYETAKP